MNMITIKKILIVLLLISVVQLVRGQNNSLLWMQQPTVSPDGKWIAFEYKGNLFKVPSKGGNAVPLTIGTSYNGYPVWSHDGEDIAFASNRYGNFDVFIISSSGGTARRISFDSSKDIPYDFSADNKLVYFGTDKHDIYSSVRFPMDNLWMKLYSVPSAGGRSLMVNSAGTEYVHFNKAGDKFLFQDRKGNEDGWRKHHKSPVTRDIWIYDNNKKSYTRLTDFEGEDREPVWGKGNSFYYLSEKNGDQNLFKSSIDQPAAITQLTTFTKNPVRYLSRSEDDLLVFTQNGELYTFREGQAPEKITVTFNADFNIDNIKIYPVKDDIAEIAVSPNGKEVAYVYHGEVFVAATDGAEVKRITKTPYREGMVSFSPDGHTLIYSAERAGSWDILKVTIVNKGESYFYAATQLKTEPLIATGKDEFKGVYSPDGKSIAYLEERNTLKVYHIESKKTVTISPKGMNYSYRDGESSFTWSADSKYILISSSEGYNNNKNIILLSTDGTGDRIRLTQSVFNPDNAQWAANGKMIYYSSDKNGLRSLSQGPAQSDIYATFLNQAFFDKFKLSKLELALYNEKKVKDLISTKSVVLKKEDLDLDVLASRTLRLTTPSALISDFKLSKDSEKLYYLVKYENAFDLWVNDTRTHESKLLTKLDASNAYMDMGNDDKTLFVVADGKIKKIDSGNGSVTDINIDSKMDIDAEAEREVIFEHVYSALPKKFIDSALHGTDWSYYHDQYKRFLPHINNNIDFQILLSEFLGELNSSHTGAGIISGPQKIDQTAALGLLFDQSVNSSGLVVTEVLKEGPFDIAGSRMRKGSVIDKIDGLPILQNTDWSYLLNNKTNQYTSISFHNPGANKIYQETVKPISQQKETRELLYKRWIHTMEHLTDSLSGGKVGYVHIPQMDEESLRNTIDKVDGKNQGKKAIIIDTRFNGGGNIHEELNAFFDKKQHLIVKPQGQSLIQDALKDGSRKPTGVLISEGNYSDAYNFPYQYQKMGIGKLIGTPVAGTGTGVFWENQINDMIYVGFPVVGLSWTGETDLRENHQLEPDIKVYNHYDKILEGEDEQLEAAVKEMLKEIK